MHLWAKLGTRSDVEEHGREGNSRGRISPRLSGSGRSQHVGWTEGTHTVILCPFGGLGGRSGSNHKGLKLGS
jgi:hypothetical protein